MPAFSSCHNAASAESDDKPHTDDQAGSASETLKTWIQCQSLMVLTLMMMTVMMRSAMHLACLLQWPGCVVYDVAYAVYALLWRQRKQNRCCISPADFCCNSSTLPHALPSASGGPDLQLHEHAACTSLSVLSSTTKHAVLYCVFTPQLKWLQLAGSAGSLLFFTLGQAPFAPEMLPQPAVAGQLRVHHVSSLSTLPSRVAV